MKHIELNEHKELGRILKRFDLILWCVIPNKYRTKQQMQQSKENKALKLIGKLIDVMDNILHEENKNVVFEDSIKLESWYYQNNKIKDLDDIHAKYNWVKEGGSHYFIKK